MSVPTVAGLAFRLVLILSTTLFASKANAVDALAPNWDRGACVPRITNLLSNGTSIPQNYFAVPPTSISNTTDYILTVIGCRAFCGEPSHSYWNADAGVRLITWLLPILLMVVNVPFPDVGRGRFATVAILLGNPVQFVWGMILEVEGWMASRRVAREILEKSQDALCLGRAIALYQKIGADPCVIENPVDVRLRWHYLLLGAETRLGAGSRNALNGEEQQNEQTTTRAMVSQVQPEEMCFTQRLVHCRTLIRKLDRDLADFRRTDTLRALLASTVYIFLTLSSFSSKLSEGSPGSGGKIGLAALLTFVLASVGLGNAVGDFHLAGCEKAFRGFFVSLGRPDEPLLSKTDHTSHLTIKWFGTHEARTPSRGPSPWSGCMPSYRTKFRVGKWPRMCIRFVLSIMPLSLAFAASEAIITTPPVYFSCRSKLVLGIYFLWLLSFFSNWIFTWLNFASGRYLFRLVVVKESVIAIVNLVFINLASAGWGNTCECWGGETGRVQLNPASVFIFNNEKRYPIVVGACFALQVLVVGLVLAPSWRGYRMMWKEGIPDNDSARN